MSVFERSVLLLAAIAVAAAIGALLARLLRKEAPVDRERLLDLQNTWHCPLELISLPTPRPIKYTGYAKGMFAIGALFLAAGIVIVEFSGSYSRILLRALPYCLAFTVTPSMVLRQRKMLVWGEPAGAIVSRVSSARGGQAVWYQFLDPAGNIVKGRTIDTSLGASSQMGQTVTILYNPGRPTRNILYPPPYVRLRARIH